MFSLEDFDYPLPPHLIAQHPLENRADSRLLVVGSDEAGVESACEFALSESTFAQLGAFVKRGDLLVVNNTKVLPARVYGNKPSGGHVEVLLERVLCENRFLALARANKSMAIGQQVVCGEYVLQVSGRDGMFYEFTLIQGDASGDASGDPSIVHFFESMGNMPLPPYIQRAQQQEDLQRYQTVYGQKKGAVAAPTAGLHFNEALIASLKAAGIGWAEVTLHVGAGTFAPVKVQDIQQHQMHREWIEVDQNLCEQIAQTKANGGRVIAVGTTVVRALESAAVSGTLQACEQDTQIFIYPGFKFNVVDALITNFHLPKSTLLMLVSAFAGYERIRHAYRYAVANEFRFFSYGDAMLLYRES